jgi:hypothetical protein
VLLPTAILFFPALGLVLAGSGAFITALLALALLPIADLLHPKAGGQRGTVAASARRRGAVPSLAAVVAFLAFSVTGLVVDRFDAAHPVPTHLMYALDADTGQARWLSAEADPQQWTRQYVSGAATTVTSTLPAFGPEELHTGPAPAATLPAPVLTPTGDTTAGTQRTVTFRLASARPARLITLHVAEGTTVTRATVAGRDIPTDESAGSGWGFGFVFHAPPTTGVEVTLTVTAGSPLRLRVMDASDGLTALPGFQARPADVGIVGSHSSEMAAVARTYTL